MTLAATEAELRRILEEVAFTRSYGFKLEAIDDGQCTLVVPFQAAFERPGGLVSGQVFMAAADVAMWLAIMTRLGSRDGSVTAGMTSAFLGAARGEPVREVPQLTVLEHQVVRRHRRAVEPRQERAHEVPRGGAALERAPGQVRRRDRQILGRRAVSARLLAVALGALALDVDLR